MPSAAPTSNGTSSFIRTTWRRGSTTYSWAVPFARA
jgi:hypothetical protein